MVWLYGRTFKRQCLYYTSPIRYYRNGGAGTGALLQSIKRPYSYYCLYIRNTHSPYNKYASASTLGSDRLAASIGAFELYPHKNVLVIDAGTCIKYNFTNAANQYLGGAISPGLNMRFKAMHDYTSRLPLLELDDTYDALVGTTTQGSMLSGVIHGSVAEIDGFIHLYTEQYPGLICVITGGDGEYLAKRLKNPIFTHQNLVLKGLNYILNSTHSSE